MVSAHKKFFACSAITLLLTGTALHAQPPAVDLIIDNVTVVDVADGKLAVKRAIVIGQGKIIRIVRAGSVKSSAGLRRVDGAGSFVVPGYNDMHSHNLNTPGADTSLPVMLASGITGFRQMAGSPALLAARAAADAGDKPLLPQDSPALLAIPGTVMAGPAFALPAAGVAEVARQKVEGADFIKVVDVPPSTLLAVADAAYAAGLPLAGHLPPTVDPREALRHHMAAIEHVGPGISLILACSRDEEALRAIVVQAAANAPGIDFNMPPAALARMLANPMMTTPPQAYGVMQRALLSQDEAKCRAFASEVARSDTWMVPTLSRLEAMNLGNTPELRGNPELRFVPAPTRQLWLAVGNDFETKLTAEQKQILADLQTRQLQLTKLFVESGVKMLTGTDFGGQWIVPGALHHEFDLLARAGVAPLRILQMTTRDPAIFLKRESSMGSVAVGRNADLVLLGADPTKSVAALHEVRGVVRAGRYLDHDALEMIKEKAAASLQP